MRLAHLSDLHLGYRQYQRQTPAGINQREADVAAAFARAIDRLIAIRSDVIVFGGDIFHTVRPTNPAILHAFAQFSRLRAALPDTPVVMVMRMLVSQPRRRSTSSAPVTVPSDS